MRCAFRLPSEQFPYSSSLPLQSDWPLALGLWPFAGLGPYGPLVNGFAAHPRRDLRIRTRPDLRAYSLAEKRFNAKDAKDAKSSERNSFTWLFAFLAVLALTKST